jgi:hypothetical protein
MTRTIRNLSVAVGMSVALASAAWGQTTTYKLRVSKPTNEKDATVTISFEPGTEKCKKVPVTIPPDSSAKKKRELIRTALEKCGYDAYDGAEDNELEVRYLRDGTKMKIDLGTTGEIEDRVVQSGPTRNAKTGWWEFVGVFDPIARDGTLAIFTGGIVTDLGEYSVRISAEELDFRTDGPTIVAALYERLVRPARKLGAALVLAADDRLEIYFDPAYSVEQAGVILGTTSPSEGCRGGMGLFSIRPWMPNEPTPIPNPKPTKGDGDGDMSDLAILLAAYGTTEGDLGYDFRVDLNGDGTIDFADLAELVAHYESSAEE